jgi:multidrug efflux system membrane fusion protein
MVRTEKNALVIPTPVVQRGPNGPFVYVVGEDHTASLRPVRVASTEGNLTLISDGLKEGEQVVLDGQSQLHPGAKVQPQQKGEGKGHPERAQVSP